MKTIEDWRGLCVVLVNEKIVKADRNLSVRDVYSRMKELFAEEEMMVHEWPWTSETMHAPEIEGSYIECWHPPSFVVDGKHGAMLSEEWRIERV